ncbi:MAG: type II toxin-antitoxin system RelE/ParE family toxin [Thermoanaerobaculales bacterium]|nr:type II toxin-antitoxin system RelE/ParE family toxin [Thermoanaerobaculales bacterium]
MKKYRYLSPARSELRDAARYYRERSRLAALSFVQSVQDAIEQIIEFPESAPKIRGQVRGKTVSRFPYTLMYRVEKDVVVVLAVAHHKQRPEYWIHRDT